MARQAKRLHGFFIARPLRPEEIARERAALAPFSKEELERAVVLGANKIKMLERYLKEYSEAYDSAKRKNEIKGKVRLIGDAKEEAKQEIKKIWAERFSAASGRLNQAAFGREMQKLFNVIEEPRSIENWTREWKVEKAREVRSSTSTGLDEEEMKRSQDFRERVKALPEILRKVGYYPPFETEDH